jgi:hypothetical protein
MITSSAILNDGCFFVFFLNIPNPFLPFSFGLYRVFLGLLFASLKLAREDGY